MKKYILRLLPSLHRFIVACRLDYLAAKLGIFKPRIIVHVDGGLASQMFQFALGYVVSKKTGLPLFLETAFFKDSCKDCSGVKNRFFLLTDTFPSIRRICEGRLIESTKSFFLKLFKDNIFSERSSSFIPRPEILSGHTLYLSDYYPIEYYIKDSLDELRDLFSFQLSLNKEEQELKKNIEAAPSSCFIHIRRGDFVNSPLDVCSPDYFHRAIRKILQLHPDVTFFVFSNQEQYAKEVCENSHIDAPFVYISGRNEVDPRVDFYLMTCCRHGIFSNSGFSLAAGLFGTAAKQECVYPTYWNSSSPNKELTEQYFREYLPKHWISLPPHDISAD